MDKKTQKQTKSLGKILVLALGTLSANLGFASVASLCSSKEFESKSSAEKKEYIQNLSADDQVKLFDRIDQVGCIMFFSHLSQPAKDLCLKKLTPFEQTKHFEDLSYPGMVYNFARLITCLDDKGQLKYFGKMDQVGRNIAYRFLCKEAQQDAFIFLDANGREDNFSVMPSPRRKASFDRMTDKKKIEFFWKLTPDEKKELRGMLGAVTISEEEVNMSYEDYLKLSQWNKEDLDGRISKSCFHTNVGR